MNVEDYWTVRNSGARVRRTDRGVLEVTGRDRATWLQGLLTNDVVAVHDGQSCYSAYLTPQGRMITDMQVVVLADRILLDVPAPLAASLRDRLDALIFAEDVHVSDVSDSIAVWGAYGPRVSSYAAEGRYGGRAEAREELQSEGGQGFNTSIADTGHGLPGLLVYLSSAEPLPEPLSELPEIDLETLDVLRVEAGTPKFLVDMNEDTIPLEAGIEHRAISFTKGCYVGQEVIVRVTHRGGGRVAKRLARWRVVPDSTPQPAIARATVGGAHIFSGDRDIGRVTSAVYSPAQNAHIGLGYVHRDFVAAGTPIAIHAGDARLDAVVL